MIRDLDDRFLAKCDYTKSVWLLGLPPIGNLLQAVFQDYEFQRQEYVRSCLKHRYELHSRGETFTSPVTGEEEVFISFKELCTPNGRMWATLTGDALA